jgi:uncharacterized membrane protein YphA (DoxX/SURF4 family)
MYDLVHPGVVAALGRSTRPALGETLGVGLAWSAVFVQLAASAALLARKRVEMAATTLLVLWSLSALLYQWPYWNVVGGGEVTGHPGVELSALVVACLAAVAAGEGGAARTALNAVRIAAAIAIFLHGGNALLNLDFEGMRAWGEQMASAGWPMGVALVWGVVTVQAVASCLLLARRMVKSAALAQIAVMIAGILTTHAPYWFVVGPGRYAGRGWAQSSGSDEGGMELSVLLIAAFATAWAGSGTRAGAPSARSPPQTRAVA